MKVSGQIAVVTGAASGLGVSVARRLDKLGARVAFVDINESVLQQASQSNHGKGYVCDVSHGTETSEVVERICSELGPPKVLVNCAGIGPSARVVGRNGPHDLDLFHRIVHVNLLGTFNMMRLVAAKMIAHARGNESNGVIVNTASVAAFEGQIGQAAYAASKGGIVSLTLPAAREFAQFGIRVMCIAPGLFQTPLLDGLSGEIAHSLSGTIPYPKRLGNAEEFSALVQHIIENDYLNAETIRLDGGLRMPPK